MREQGAGGEEERGERLPFAVKLAYGGVEGSAVMFWTLFYMFFMIFMTDTVGIAPGTAGLIMMIATLWDAVTDPLVGIWSDRTKCRYGRRRPFIVSMAIPFGIVGWLLFTDWGLGYGWTIAYFVTMVILFFTAYTVLNVPYTALAPEMTQDYDERSRLVAYRMGWSQVFTMVGVVGFLLAGVLGDAFHNSRAGWSATAALFGVIAVFPILWTWRATRGYELFPEETRVRLGDIWRDAMRNRTFVLTVGAYTAGVVAMDSAATVLVYFCLYNLGYSEARTDTVMMVLIGVTVFWVPAIAACATRWGKRAAFMFFAGLWALAMALGIVFIYPGRELLLYVVIVVAAGGVTAVPFVGWAMIPDAVEVDELKTGQRREGMFSGIATFVQKLGSGMALLLVGQILSAVGYVADQPQSEKALLGIRFMLGWGTAFFLLISIVLCYLIPMTKKKHAALREEIRLKREGEVNQSPDGRCDG